MFPILCAGKSTVKPWDFPSVLDRVDVHIHGPGHIFCRPKRFFPNKAGDWTHKQWAFYCGKDTSIDLFLFGFPSPACCLDLGVSGTMMHHIHQFVVLRVEHRARALFSKFTINVLWPIPRGSHRSQYIRSLPTTNAWNNLRMFSPRHPWWSLRLVGCFSEAKRKAWLRVL